MYKILISPYSRTFYNEWKINPKRSDYNIVFDQNLEGSLDLERLNRAFKRFVSDHIILNSYIENQDEELYWVPNKTIYGLEYCKEPLKSKDLLTFIASPFDLENGPLYRLKIVKLSPRLYRLVIVLHHIVIDGLSVDQFIQELSSYYNDESYKNKIPTEAQVENIQKLSESLLKYVVQIKERSQLIWKKRLEDTNPVDLRFLKPAYNNQLTHRNIRKKKEENLFKN